MSYYIISIGGSGAKFVEAVLHMSAAGMMPEGELNILFIDPDVSNGSLERVQKTLHLYRDCKKLKLGNVDFFKTPIDISKPNVWSPFTEAQPTLENFFHYDILKAQDEAGAHLFDVLYSPNEKEVILDEGFLGHPSIGAAVMAKTVKLDETEPWKSFRDKIRVDAGSGSESRVILAGSIFGGTGASGIPTISRLIRNEFKDISTLKIGGILILPYFSFLPAEKEVQGGKTFSLNSENFILNTQAALRYYYNQGNLKYFDRAYILGEQAMSTVRNTSLGGKSQANAPHFLEIYAALGAIDFFSGKNSEEDVSLNYSYKMVARNVYEKLEWTDLPDHAGGKKVKKGLGDLASFAFVYLKVYYPMLTHIKENGEAYKAPWFVEFFERKQLDLKDENVHSELLNMKNYCENYLKWFANIHNSSEDLEVALVRCSAFSEVENNVIRLLEAQHFMTYEFGSLILPDSKEQPNALSSLWERMCDASVRDKHAVGTGRFIHALYSEIHMDSRN